MDSYYYLTTSNNSEGTQYKINLDAMDFCLLPIDKLMDKYQNTKSCIKLTIYNAKTRCEQNEVCSEEIKGNLLDYEVEVRENHNNEECVNNEEDCANHGNVDSDNHENVESGNLKEVEDGRNYEIVSSGNHYIAETGCISKLDLIYKNDVGKDSSLTEELSSKDIYIKHTTRPTIVYCSLCKVNITNNKHNIAEHIKGWKHCELLKVQLSKMKTNAIFEVENDNTRLWCKFCKIHFKFNDLFNHIENREDHVRRIEEINELIKDEDISIDSYCEIFTQDKAYCRQCKVWVPCRTKCLEQHIIGEKHERLSKEYYIKVNAIHYVKDDEDKLFCKICNMYFEYITYEDLYKHIDDNTRHSELLDEIDELIEGEDIEYDNYCDKVMDQYKFYCTRCSVWIPCNYECIRQHVNGSRHNNNA